MALSSRIINIQGGEARLCRKKHVENNSRKDQEDMDNIKNKHLS